MKKAFFVVVVLAVFAPAMVFAQNARWAEVRVSYNLFGGIGVSDNVYVRAVDQKNAEGLAVLKFEEENLFSPVTRAVFVRWLTDAEYTQIQKQEQERQKREQQQQAQRQQQERQQKEQQEKEQAAFYGTWRSADRDTITIDAGTIKFTQYSTDGYHNFSIERWIKIRDSDIPGFYLDASSRGREDFSTYMSSDISIYLYDNGKSLKWGTNLFSSGPTGPNSKYFYKQ